MAKARALVAINPRIVATGGRSSAVAVTLVSNKGIRTG
jgi:hypothetical protein